MKNFKQHSQIKDGNDYNVEVCFTTTTTEKEGVLEMYLMKYPWKIKIIYKLKVKITFYFKDTTAIKSFL